MSYCKCGAQLRWAVTASGKRMPLDFEPDPAGNVHLTDAGQGRKIAVVLGPLDRELFAEDAPLYMPHHATCPNVEEFRR